MRPSLSPQDYAAKWRHVELKERSAAQAHFDDLCRLVGHPTPVEEDPTGRPLVQAIAQAAKELVEKRDAWLNPPDAGSEVLKKRTLTNLYGQRPTWLALAHEKLDQAVLDTYGWPQDLGDEEILERLLALNLERAGKI